MRLCCDIDGVYADWNSAFARLLISADGNRIPREWWTANRVTPPCWEWDEAAGYPPEVISSVWRRITSKGSTFWKNLKPLPYAGQVLKRLNGLSSRGHEVVFLTNRVGWNAKRQTEQWLYDIGGVNYPTVIIAPSGEAKIPILRNIGADLFIDDRLETLNECVRSAVEQGPAWKIHLFLLNTTYNQDDRLGGYQVVDTPQQALETVGLWK